MTVSLLRRTPLFRTLPEAEIRRIAKISRLRKFPAGSKIFSKAEQAKHMFIVARGRVKIYISSGLRKRKTFDYLESGNFFGEMALLDGKERSASAQAVEDSQLLLIDKREFRQLLLAHPGLACLLLKTLSDRLRGANEEIESLIFKNVLGRLARILVQLGGRYGKSAEGGLLIDHPFSQQELADLIGTSREPLSRALASLRRAQLVGARHGRLFLQDPERLKELTRA